MREVQAQPGRNSEEEERAGGMNEIFGTSGRLNIMVMMETDDVRRPSNPDQDCWYCGCAAEAIDHIVPRVTGGPSIKSNLVPVCKSCNSSKGYKPLDVWKIFLIERRGLVYDKLWFELHGWSK